MKAVKIYTTIQTFEKEKKSGVCEKMMKMKKRREWGRKVTNQRQKEVVKKKPS